MEKIFQRYRTYKKIGNEQKKLEGVRLSVDIPVAKAKKVGWKKGDDVTFGFVKDKKGNIQPEYLVINNISKSGNLWLSEEEFTEKEAKTFKKILQLKFALVGCSKEVDFDSDKSKLGGKPIGEKKGTGSVSRWRRYIRKKKLIL